MTFTSYQCPETGQPLVQATEDLVRQVNQAISDQVLVNVDGQCVEQLIDGGWVAQQKNRLYPVREQIICLIAQQALDLDSLPAATD